MKTCKTILLMFFAVTLMLGSISAALKNQMSIQVKNGQIRQTPSFLGKVIATLAYGDRVDVVEERTGWAFIKIPGSDRSGWVHLSALTHKKIVLSAGTADVEQAASSDEVALAGKGFNKQVEGEFKSKNQHLDYAWIDKMERFSVSQQQIEQFVREGDLYPGGVK